MCYKSVFDPTICKTSCNSDNTFSKCADYGMGALIQLKVTKLKLTY
jgi:hypothetical protein